MFQRLIFHNIFYLIFSIFVTPNLTLRSWDNHQFKRKSE
jgi:hypothetical protein